MKKIFFILFNFLSFAFFATASVEEQKNEQKQDNMQISVKDDEVKILLRKPTPVEKDIKINRKYGFEIGSNSGYVMDLTNKLELIFKIQPSAVMFIDWHNFKSAPNVDILNSISLGYNVGLRYNFNKNEFSSSFFASLAFVNNYLINFDTDMSFGGYADFGYIWRAETFRLLFGISSTLEYFIENKSINYFNLLRPLLAIGFSF